MWQAWRQRWKKFVKNQQEFYLNNRITRLGYFFIGFAFLVGFGAVNTGVNLLYLIFSIIICLIIMNGILALLMFSRLSVDIDLPELVFAKEVYPLHLKLTNRKKFLSSYSLLIEDEAPQAESATTEAISPQDYCLQVKPGQAVLLRCQRQFFRRGWHEFAGVKVHCVFPFGLVQRIRHFRSTDKILVLPNVHRTGFLQEFLENNFEARSINRIGNGSDIFDVRPYRNEDMRHIHWKLSARKNELMAKDFEDSLAEGVNLAFYAGQGADDFDSAIDAVASFIWAWTANHRLLNLYLPDELRHESVGRSSIETILKALALLEPLAPDKLSAWWDSMAIGSGLVLVPKGVPLPQSLGAWQVEIVS